MTRRPLPTARARSRAAPRRTRHGVVRRPLYCSSLAESTNPPPTTQHNGHGKHTAGGSHCYHRPRGRPPVVRRPMPPEPSRELLLIILLPILPVSHLVHVLRAAARDPAGVVQCPGHQCLGHHVERLRRARVVVAPGDARRLVHSATLLADV